MKAHRETEVYLYSFFNLGGWWLTPRPGRLTPEKQNPVPVVLEAGWTSGPVCKGAENLALTGIRSPDRPAPSD